ncbi:hypothetical protein K4L44_13025 [Halosquirtibacter laminarini]|uniref:Uncharacterized protein n=1 Tax=Halosquirtibacter laminarini TaxID=3374600 RepID=A0AC61NN42_9BACT|nr:hypothetical protein K4L44_13025 [Prolixibacteraceae bacterium]
MKNKLFQLIVLVGLFILSSCSKNQTNLITSNAIGKVKITMSHGDLEQNFKKENLKDFIDEGSGANMTEIKFPNQKNNLTIIWKDNKKSAIYSISTRQDGSTWKTAQGVHVGSTLSEIEKLNGKGFEIIGYEIDRDLAGTVTSWNEGKLKNMFHIQFKLTKDVGNDYMKLIGDQGIPSSNEVLLNAAPVVSSITIVKK